MEFARRLAVPCLGIELLLAGCGGGGGSSTEPPPPPPPPTPLPSSISVSAPEQATWQTAVAFDSSVTAAPAGWRYEWRFGDGATSSDARPQHSYASAGEYTVSLTITDAQGASVATTRKLTVQAWANLRSAACSQPGVGGWCRIGVETAAAPVSAVYRLDATQAWATTTFGDLWRTVDAGKTWQAVSSAASNDAKGLYFEGATNGWLVAKAEGLGGSDELVWRTTDGGASFSRVLPPDVSAHGAYNIRVLGGGKVIAEENWIPGSSWGSVDGGSTWRANPTRSFPLSAWGYNLPVLPPAARDGRTWRLNGNVVEVSEDAGLNARSVGALPAACVVSGGDASIDLSPGARLITVQFSEFLSSGAYLTRACFSADGGATWVEAAPGQVQSGPVSVHRRVASFIGDTGGVIRDAQGLWWSNPLGSPWQRIHLNWDFDALSQVGVIDSTHLWGELREGGASPVLGVHGPATFFTADNRSWVASLPTSPDLTRSYQYRIQSTIGDASNHVFDAQRGLQLWQGQLYLTADNGVTRTPVKLSGAEPVPVGGAGAGVFLNARQGFVVSAQSTLLQSDDGGKTWSTNTTLPAGHVYNVWSGPEQSLWVSAQQDAIEGRLLRSMDAGKTWTSVFSGTVLGVQFTSSSQGWLHTFSRVMRSSDLGQTWQAAGTLGNANMKMLDASRGVAGYARYAGSSSPPIPCLQTTEDGGVTWSACVEPQVASGAGLHGVATGAGSYWLFNSSGLHRSNDFGKTWTPVTLPGPPQLRQRLNEVVFADAQRGWAVSAMGGVWATSDAGMTWALQPTGTSANLKRLSIVDTRAVWAFGANTILGTATGGK